MCSVFEEKTQEREISGKEREIQSVREKGARNTGRYKANEKERESKEDRASETQASRQRPKQTWRDMERETQRTPQYQA